MGKRNRNKEPAKPLGRDWVRLDLVAGPPDARVVLDAELTRYRDMDQVIRRWNNKHQILTVKTIGKSEERRITHKGTTYDDVRYIYTVLDHTKPPSDDPHWTMTNYDGWVRKYGQPAYDDVASWWDCVGGHRSSATRGPVPDIETSTEPVLS